MVAVFLAQLLDLDRHDAFRFGARLDAGVHEDRQRAFLAIHVAYREQRRRERPLGQVERPHRLDGQREASDAPAAQLDNENARLARGACLAPVLDQRRNSDVGQDDVVGHLERDREDAGALDMEAKIGVDLDPAALHLDARARQHGDARFDALGAQRERERQRGEAESEGVLATLDRLRQRVEIHLEDVLLAEWAHADALGARDSQPAALARGAADAEIRRGQVAGHRDGALESHLERRAPEHLLVHRHLQAAPRLVGEAPRADVGAGHFQHLQAGGNGEFEALGRRAQDLQVELGGAAHDALLDAHVHDVRGEDERWFDVGLLRLGSPGDLDVALRAEKREQDRFVLVVGRAVRPRGFDAHFGVAPRYAEAEPVQRDGRQTERGRGELLGARDARDEARLDRVPALAAEDQFVALLGRHEHAGFVIDPNLVEGDTGEVERNALPTRFEDLDRERRFEHREAVLDAAVVARGLHRERERRLVGTRLGPVLEFPQLKKLLVGHHDALLLSAEDLVEFRIRHVNLVQFRRSFRFRFGRDRNDRVRAVLGEQGGGQKRDENEKEVGKRAHALSMTHGTYVAVKCRSKAG